MLRKRDLEKFDSIIDRVNRIPSNVDFKVPFLQGGGTQEQRAQSLLILDEVNDVFRELQAFIKVKLPEGQHFLKACAAIDFDTEVMGIPVRTNSLVHHQKAWSEGMNKLNQILKTIRSELVLRIEDFEENSGGSSLKNIEKGNTQISHSNVVIGGINGSHVAYGDTPAKPSLDIGDSEPERKKIHNSPTRPLQKLGIILSVIIGVASIILAYLMYKDLI